MKDDLATQMITRFKKRYEKATGSKVIVMSIQDVKSRTLTLSDIQNIAVSAVQHELSEKDKKYSRQKEVVTARQCYCKIARDMGYTFMEIAKQIDKDHSTIIHAVNRSNDMLETNDKTYISMYNRILTDINKTLDGRTIHRNTEAQNNTKSTLSSIRNKK